MSRLPSQLIEGVDYYIEAGRWIFTAAYHLKRGHCCENGCRHCPYERLPLDPVRTTNQGLPKVDRKSE